MRPLTALAGRYWHTLKWLKPRQIGNRLYRRLHRPRPQLAPAPPCEGTPPANPPSRWQACPRAASLLGPARFRFLSQTHELAAANDWNHASWPKLWLYNLHYFDDLLATGAQERTTWHAELIERWIDENPPGYGNGWEPYTVSKRIVNWVAWCWSGNVLSPRAIQSLAVQVRWLEDSLEYHLMGNHLWCNGKALLFAGSFFQGGEAQRWLSRGESIVRVQFAEQALPDGGHFERTALYHALFVEDVLDLVQLHRWFPARLSHYLNHDLQSALPALLYWLRCMTHPDGRIALFNDAAFGIAPTLASLEQHAARVAPGMPPGDAPQRPLAHLERSGFMRIQHGPAVAWLEVGGVAPDYLPGHAHAGTLGCELSIGEHRILVDTGTSRYSADAERLAQRETAAHNTLEVAGCSSSEVWSAFRVARRARTRVATLGDFPEHTEIEASHTGYLRLPTRNVHTRRWHFSPGRFCVSDTVTGQAVGSRAYWHLGPDMTALQRTGARTLNFKTPEGQLVHLAVSAGELSVVPSLWHCEFGQPVPNTRIVVALSGDQLESVFTW